MLRTQTCIFGQGRTAWIHAHRIVASSGNLWKRILGSFFLFLAWILHSKATQCGILLQIYREHGNRATILRHHPREPCAPIKMAIAGSSNSSWRPLLRGQKEKSKAREHFCVRKIYFWRLKEHFGRYFLKEWRFPLRNELRESDKRSKHFPSGDHFINSHNLISWNSKDIVRRKLMLVTKGLIGLLHYHAINLL